MNRRRLPFRVKICPSVQRSHVRFRRVRESYLTVAVEYYLRRLGAFIEPAAVRSRAVAGRGRLPAREMRLIFSA